MFRIAINKLFKWLFLECSPRLPPQRPGFDSQPGPLVLDGDDLAQVSSIPYQVYFDLFETDLGFSVHIDIKSYFKNVISATGEQKIGIT